MHIPTDKTKYNRLTNKLKAKLKLMRDASFTDSIQIHNLSSYDYSIWKPIKNKRKPNEASPPIRAIPPTAGPWARSDKEKSELFAYIFTPHNDAKDHEIEKI
jgi:hypothetical protein